MLCLCHYHSHLNEILFFIQSYFSHQILMNVQYPLRIVHNYAPTLMEVMYAPVVKVTLLEVIAKPAMVYSDHIFDNHH